MTRDELPAFGAFGAMFGLADWRDGEVSICGCPTTRAALCWRCPLCDARGPEMCTRRADGRVDVSARNPLQHAADCPAAEMSDRPPLPPQRRVWIESALWVACPYCTVAPGAICMTATGRYAGTNHAARRKLADQWRCDQP